MWDWNPVLTPFIAKPICPGENHAIKKRIHTKESHSRPTTLHLPNPGANCICENRTLHRNWVSHVLQGQEISLELEPQERKHFKKKKVLIPFSPVHLCEIQKSKIREDVFPLEKPRIAWVLFF